jgi:hypothetical protein
MPEGRMSQIVCQPGHFDEVRITAQSRTDLARNLGDLECVGQSRAREIQLTGHDDLRLGG